jgi:hypothetical protein
MQNHFLILDFVLALMVEMEMCRWEQNSPFRQVIQTAPTRLLRQAFLTTKKNNRISVTIEKKEELLQVFIDNDKIAEYEKAIPAAHLFNAMSFYSYNSGSNDKFYIGNNKISKD